MEQTGRMDREKPNTKATLTRRDRKQMHLKFGVHSSLEMVLSALEQKII